MLYKNREENKKIFKLDPDFYPITKNIFGRI